jgi:flotillin
MGALSLLAASLGAVVVVALAAVVSALYLANNLLYICEPNEVLVFSGGFGTGEDGLGFRTIKGGRGFRMPLIERVDRLELTNMTIDVVVHNAYSKGGIPLHVQGVANVKIASRNPALRNAVERLLGKSRDEVTKIAKDLLEGNLRGVLARLTPEQVNEDKLAFAEQLLAEAEHDLTKLGLVLVTMKIQNVSDDRGYLNSLGRIKSADIVKSSRIAEARAKAAAMIQDAGNRERARLREIESSQAIAEAEANRRIVDAKTRSVALVAEAHGKVVAEIARAEGALEAETQRVEQTRGRLRADIIEPAKASMEAEIAAAKGRAATILERGRASNAVLEEMILVWREAGANARDIFLMQKLQGIMGSMVSTIGAVKVDRLTMLPPSDGNASAARAAVRLNEELKSAIGLDVPRMLQNVTGTAPK